MSAALDKSTQYIGGRCRHGHMYNDTDFSVRYIKSNACVICAKLADKRYRENNREKEKIRSLKYNEAHRDELNGKSRLRHEKNRDEIIRKKRIYNTLHRDDINDKNRRHYAEHKEKYAISGCKYRNTTSGKLATAKKNKTRYDMIKNNGGYHTTDELIECHRKFDESCAYCGCDVKDTYFDHVIPLSAGGTSDITNLIPSCRSCNSSKQANVFKKWFIVQDFYTDGRMNIIMDHIGG